MLFGLGALPTGCIGRSPATSNQSQSVLVQRGSISIEVTGTGNLVLKNKQSLSFGQTGLVTSVETAKVSEVKTAEGQVVDMGQVLVKADTTDWQKRINNLKHQLDAAKANLVQTQTNVINAQSGVATTQSSLATAQYNLATTQFNLKAQQDVKAAQDKIDNANTQLQQSKVMLLESLSLTPPSGQTNYWTQRVAVLTADVITYQQELRDLLDDPAVKGVSVTDITTKQAQIKQAQTAIELAQAGVVQAQKNIELAQASVIVAQNAVEDAQTALNTEQNSPQEITAPFNGLITKVNVTQGDIVQRNAKIIEIAEPDKFEVHILVTERDVTSLSIGGDSTVSFDALPELSFPAKITRIAPLATIQQGVVNYQITAELTSTKPVPIAGSTASSTSLAGLKDGFSAVLNITVQKKDNILIVPSRAISHEGQNYTVRVDTGTSIETRNVKVGITDFQNTEIIEGLNQGDKVVLPVIPTAAPTTPGFFGGGGQ